MRNSKGPRAFYAIFKPKDVKVRNPLMSPKGKIEFQTQRVLGEDICKRAIKWGHKGCLCCSWFGLDLPPVSHLQITPTKSATNFFKRSIGPQVLLCLLEKGPALMLWYFVQDGQTCSLTLLSRVLLPKTAPPSPSTKSPRRPSLLGRASGTARWTGDASRGKTRARFEKKFFFSKEARCNVHPASRGPPGRSGNGGCWGLFGYKIYKLSNSMWSLKFFERRLLLFSIGVLIIKCLRCIVSSPPQDCSPTSSLPSARRRCRTLSAIASTWVRKMRRKSAGLRSTRKSRRRWRERKSASRWDIGKTVLANMWTVL